MGNEKGWSRRSGHEKVMPDDEVMPDLPALPPELAGLPPEALHALLKAATDDNPRLTDAGSVYRQAFLEREDEHDRKQRLVIYRCAALTGLLGPGTLGAADIERVVEAVERCAHAMLKAERPPEST